jgi:cytochrome c553
MAARQLLLCALLALSGLAAAADGIASLEGDLDIGEEINETCAGCHGEFGQGGKGGEYPRIAGQPRGFLIQQLLQFRDRTRLNLAMVEYVDHRQMPDEDIVHISAYLAQLQLPTKLPAVDESAPGFNAYQRLLEAKKIIQIPRAAGDVNKGERLYGKECASCHGKDGAGKHAKDVPMLAGQYTSYLWRQVPKYLDGRRVHDSDSPDEEILAEFSDAELQDIFAYLSILDD